MTLRGRSDTELLELEKTGRLAEELLERLERHGLIEAAFQLRRVCEDLSAELVVG